MLDRAGAQTAREVHPPLIIRRVDAIAVALPLKKPMKMAGVTITHAENLLVRVEAARGVVGWGEAASAPTMTGDTLGGLVAAVRDHLAPLLIRQNAWTRPTLTAMLRKALIGNTGAHSAVEMALLDLSGRAAGLPMIDLLGGVTHRDAVAPMWLLGNATTEQDIAEARVKEREGFHFFKLKIATKPLAEEIAGTLALREALGPDVPLCADANGGFSRADAHAYVQKIRAAGLMFVEQPLDAHDLDGLAELTRASPIPIGADEGIHSLADITAHAQRGAGGVSLKLIKLGGMSTALEAADLCGRLGLSLNIAAKIAESSIATAAAVHLACAAPSADWGVSLTHFYLAGDLVREPLPLREGSVTLPAKPGLGIDVDEATVQRMRV
jgi:muconate cycloisomerase